MMGTIWLVCCPGAQAPLVQREVRGYDPQAKIARLEDMRSLLSLASLMPGIAHGVAIYLPVYVADEDIEQALQELADDSYTDTVLVLAERLDVGLLARLMCAGATEVIAAGESAVSSDMDVAHRGEGPETRRTRDDPAADGCPPEKDAEEGPQDEGELFRIRTAAGEPKEAPPTSGEEVDGPDSAPRIVADVAPAPSPIVYGPAPEPVMIPDEDLKPEKEAEDRPQEADAGEVREDDPHEDAPEQEEPEEAPSEEVLEDPSPVLTAMVSGQTAHPEMGGAPLIVAISGRGGCGKTTLVAAMAWWAAHMGLRAAVLDLDLMFGNLHNLYGVERVCDMARLTGSAEAPACSQEAIEGTAMRIGPGLTLWGPCLAPEQAELMAGPVEELISVLRRESDVIFADTSVFWGDAVASAVSQANRCLVVGTGTTGAEAAAVRAVSLAARIGVPKTRMTCVFNRFGAHGSDEERAMRFEMAVSLHSRMRIADGGAQVAELLDFGKLGDLMVSSGAFVGDIQNSTFEMLKELGCPLGEWEERQRATGQSGSGRSRIKLPWKHEGK